VTNVTRLPIRENLFFENKSLVAINTSRYTSPNEIAMHLKNKKPFTCQLYRRLVIPRHTNAPKRGPKQEAPV